MAKVSAKFKAPKVKKQIFASRDKDLQTQFNGKSVYDVAVELDLDTDNIDIIVGQNEVYSLLFIKDDGTEIIIPMSSKLIANFEEDGLDPEDIMELQFRVTDAPVYRADASGKRVKTDEMAPFLNVGLKGGQFDYTRQNALAEDEKLEGVKN